VTEDELIAQIEALLRHLERSRGAPLNDDAALWQPSRSHRSVISTDMLVEGVDFTRELMSLEDAGWRAMAANLSDLAAMGARPVLGTVALGFPKAATQEEVLELYRGIADCAARYKISIAGGDLSSAPAWTVAITVVGEVRPSNAKLRSGGHPGDVLAVTGPLGAARAGLLGEAAGLSALRRPQPRIAEGRFLAASRNVTAMMDISDGLSTDVHRLATASGCGAALDAIPVADAARAIAKTRGEDAERFALAGGDDFELLAAIRPRAFNYLAARFAKRFGRELKKVGALRAEPGVAYNGERIERSGWDHFAASATR
jgi:thiamine-monophosphate kinase